jgi:aminoglycoside phosphotransferase (APT) family kinase protein
MVGALKYHEIVLTHGDISPRNILVQGSKVVAILNWEMSGHYPEYWDYVKTLFRPA